MTTNFSGDAGGFYAADLAAQAFGICHPHAPRRGRDPLWRAMMTEISQAIGEVDEEVAEFGMCPFGYYGA